jgi:23S rRNA (adenine2030-N6)-methyltransferase
MKYRHSFHAGNFADVHKHVTLLALIAALERKNKGLLYLDTHAGRGSYDLSTPTAEAAAGIGRFTGAAHRAPELQHYAQLLDAFRARPGQRHMYPGSPLLAPRERRGLIFIDPPYEETREDFARLGAALADGLRRFPTGVFAAWYPIKEERTTATWLAQCGRSLKADVLVSELWLYPRDSRVTLNGSGLLIANPPWQVRERMQAWLPELQAILAHSTGAGTAVRMLSESPA